MLEHSRFHGSLPLFAIAIVSMLSAGRREDRTPLPPTNLLSTSLVGRNTPDRKLPRTETP